jgi:hypothetical protein
MLEAMSAWAGCPDIVNAAAMSAAPATVFFNMMTSLSILPRDDGAKHSKGGHPAIMSVPLPAGVKSVSNLSG